MSFMEGQVVKLDRKFPLVELVDGSRLRCELSADMKKHGADDVVVGDMVQVDLPDTHDMGVIVSIIPRGNVFVRKDPGERAVAQTLAANFDRVIVAQPIDTLNMARMQRELVLAYETGAEVTVLLTKADLVDDEVVEAKVEDVSALVRPGTEVIVMSKDDAHAVGRVRALIPEGTMAVLIGKSGVGKSTLVNILMGEEVQATSKVREGDGKGRHTTVSRDILQLPVVDGLGGGKIVDMPGVRGLGLWEANEGMEMAFSDIEALAEQCRFRDCKHVREPGCAVRAAVEAGQLAPKRLQAYLDLHAEMAKNAERRRRSTWKNK